MTTLINFAFLREGTSDDGLMPHLRELLVRAGLEEVVGTARDYKGAVVDCLRQVLDEEAPVDVIFVHRDSDSRSDRAPRNEIAGAVQTLGDGLTAEVVPVVPIQELEAWILLDEAAIRTVVGKPSKRNPLAVPRPNRIEHTASPKEVLQRALLDASNTTGRRHKEERRRFPDRRRTLLERIDIDGPIRELSAWQSLERDIEEAAANLLAR